MTREELESIGCEVSLGHALVHCNSALDDVGDSKQVQHDLKILRAILIHLQTD